MGNLTTDLELCTTGSGTAVASFTIASVPRTWSRQTNQFEDGQALLVRCPAWCDLAGRYAQSLKKGMRVTATDHLRQRSYQAQDGPQRIVVEIQLDEVGPSLCYAAAQVTRQPSSQGGFQGRSGGLQGGQQSNQGCDNQGGQGGYTGGQGGYDSGYQGGGAGYPRQSAAPASPSAPTADPWGNADAFDVGSFPTFGASSDFDDDNSDPELRSVLAFPLPVAINIKICKENIMSREGPQPPVKLFKKKPDPLKATKVTEVDCKDAALLCKSISDRGKIRPRRITGMTVREWCELSKTIKSAREMVLLPYATSGR